MTLPVAADKGSDASDNIDAGIYWASRLAARAHFASRGHRRTGGCVCLSRSAWVRQRPSAVVGERADPCGWLRGIGTGQQGVDVLVDATDLCVDNVSAVVTRLGCR